jgi:hypothetical protein
MNSIENRLFGQLKPHFSRPTPQQQAARRQQKYDEYVSDKAHLEALWLALTRGAA